MAIDVEQTAFTLVLKSGDARTLAYEAFESAIDGDFAEAKAKLQEAEEELNEAHQAQVSLIQHEAQAAESKASLALAHAQDHLMTAMAELRMMERLVRILELKS